MALMILDLPWEYFLLYFGLPLAASATLWYILYRLYFNGKITIRPVAQGVISLVFALLIYFVIALFFHQG